MAKIIAFIFSSSLIFNLFAASPLPSEIKIYSSLSAKYEIISMNQKEVSLSCKKNDKCEALKKLTAKITEQIRTSKLYGHPASHFCSDASGRNIILKNSKGQEYDFCQFSDNSLIDSWDLYYAHHEKKIFKE